MKNVLIAICILFLFGSFLPDAPAQTRRAKKVKKPAAAVVAPKPEPSPEPTVETPAKRNGRPDGETSPDSAKSNSRKSAAAKIPSYYYEFVRPGFAYPRILIEHDEAGKGTISFMKDDFDEMITDPIDLTSVTMTNIDGSLAALSFLDSADVYQTARDYSNLGNMTFTFKQAGRQRTVKYNWSENKDAKALMDEYRRICNEYTWKFELSVARENQPLQTPGLMETLDSFIKRREISDPPHLIPLLTDLSNDERLPLIARNHAAKLLKQIQSGKKS